MVAHIADKAFGVYEAFVGNLDQTLRGTFTGIFFLGQTAVMLVWVLVMWVWML